MYYFKDKPSISGYKEYAPLCNICISHLAYLLLKKAPNNWQFQAQTNWILFYFHCPKLYLYFFWCPNLRLTMILCTLALFFSLKNSKKKTWQGNAVVTALDLWQTVPWFDSQPPHYQAVTCTSSSRAQHLCYYDRTPPKKFDYFYFKQIQIR